MLFARPLTARPATPADRAAIQTLARYEVYTHAHLDWKPVEDWLGRQPFWVVERGQRVVGALACPPDLPDTAWLRLFVAAEGVAVQTVWDLLWPPACEALAAQHLQMVAALSLEQWSEPLYQSAGFTWTHDVVVLSRAFGPPPAAPAPAGLTVRAATPADEAGLARADRLAFKAPWQLSDEMIHLALRQAEYVSVAAAGAEIIGYQLSTPSRTGAHLARLAVRPEWQGRGVGRALLADLIQRVQRSPGRELSVNTQHNNLASLAVYQRMGFQLTGARFPVYQLSL